MKLGFFKDSLYKFAGSIVGFIGFLFLIIGIGMTIDPKSEIGPEIMVISLIGLVPGIYLYYKGLIFSKKEKLLKETTALINTYRRISLTDLSEKLDLQLHETQEIISEAVSLKLIKGFIDRTTSEFVSENAENSSMNFKFCPSCGSQLDRIYLKGETIKCNQCGTLI